MQPVWTWIVPNQNPHRTYYLGKLHPHRFLTFQFVWKLRPLFVDGCPMSCCRDFWPRSNHGGCYSEGLWCLVNRSWIEKIVGGRPIRDDHEERLKTLWPTQDAHVTSKQFLPQRWRITVIENWSQNRQWLKKNSLCDEISDKSSTKNHCTLCIHQS